MRSSKIQPAPIEQKPSPVPQSDHHERAAELPDASPEGSQSLFYVEDSDPFDLYSYRISRIVYSGETDYQKVMIADTHNWDRVLILDGAIQSAECDEALYHEMLVQPALLRHPHPEDVLIIGGGEGATLREVLRHRTVKNATMVDLDQEVVRLCREHLEKWHRGSFEDKRVRLVFGDGRKFVENDRGRYDVVIVDVVDMLDNGPAKKLYTRQFYERIRDGLKPHGVVVVQGLEFSFLDYEPHATLSRTLKTVFPEVHSYRVDIPSFLSSWGFLVASDWFDPGPWTAAEIDAALRERLGAEGLEHVRGDFLKSAFHLCKKTRLSLTKPGPILEDGVDFSPRST